MGQWLTNHTGDGWWLAGWRTGPPTLYGFDSIEFVIRLNLPRFLFEYPNNIYYFSGWCIVLKHVLSFTWSLTHRLALALLKIKSARTYYDHETRA